MRAESGPTADSFTLDIVAPAVPKPASLLLLALPLGFLFLLNARPRRFARNVRAARSREDARGSAAAPRCPCPNGISDWSAANAAAGRSISSSPGAGTGWAENSPFAFEPRNFDARRLESPFFVDHAFGAGCSRGAG